MQTIISWKTKYIEGNAFPKASWFDTGVTRPMTIAEISNTQEKALYLKEHRLFDSGCVK